MRGCIGKATTGFHLPCYGVLAMSNNSDLIAAFLAKGGKVQRVETGARVLTEREIYAAQRDDNALIAERHERDGVIYNGLGEYIGRI